MEEPQSYGRQLFDVIKRIKKRGVLHPTVSDLRPSEFMLLHSIMRFEVKNKAVGHTGDVTLSELSEFLMLTPSAISQTVKSLIQKQLVERKINPLDRRIAYISLTPKAREILSNSEREFSDKLDQIISVLGKEETEQLIALLNKLASALENMSQPE